MTSFADTILLMGKQKVAPIAGWDEVESQLEAWAMFCTLFMGDNGVHPTTYKMFLLLEEKSGSSRGCESKPANNLPSPPPSFASYSRSSMRASARRWRGSSG